MSDSGTPIRLSFHGAVATESEAVLSEVSMDVADAPFASMLITLPPGTSTDPDEHEVAEMWFIQDGTGILESGRIRLPIQKNEVIFLPGKVPHIVHNTGDATLGIFSVWWGKR